MRKPARLLLLFALLSICASLAAQTAASPAGDWVLKLGPRTLLILTLKSSSDAAQPFIGAMTRMKRFSTSDGYSFSRIRGRIITEPIVASSQSGNIITFTVANPADDTDKDKYRFVLQDATHAQLQSTDVPAPPFALTRATTTPVISTDWNPTLSYSPDDGLPSNPEMTRLYQEDQKVRQPGAKVDWSSISQSDSDRRQATRKLLAQDALHTAEDFNHAAFIFQHGSTPDDYLLAHTLAMVAVAKGDTGLSGSPLLPSTAISTPSTSHKSTEPSSGRLKTSPPPRNLTTEPSSPTPSAVNSKSQFNRHRKLNGSSTTRSAASPQRLSKTPCPLDYHPRRLSSTPHSSSDNQPSNQQLEKPVCRSVAKPQPSLLTWRPLRSPRSQFRTPIFGRGRLRP